MFRSYYGAFFLVFRAFWLFGKKKDHSKNIRQNYTRFFKERLYFFIELKNIFGSKPYTLFFPL